MKELNFKRDTSFRKSVFVPDSFSHPAKLDSQLLIWIVEKFTKPGDVIGDFMAGSGTLMLACTLGRDVLLVELEDKFCKMMRDNWEKVRQRPQLGYEMGRCEIVQGDARNLKDLFVDVEIFSPPHGGNSEPYMSKDLLRIRTEMGRDPSKPSAQTIGYGDNPSNIGNLKYGSIDSVIASPPYEGSVSDGKESPLAGGNEEKYGRWSQGTARRISYTEDKPCKPVSHIVTSPPYENQTIRSGTKGSASIKRGDYQPDYESSDNKAYNLDNPTNIGNLKSSSYLAAMLQVYAQCYSVLKPGGLLILITKNFIRDQKEVRLDRDTVKLCRQAGFVFVDLYRRKLPAQSFWRILYHRKYPTAPEITHEDILIFRKRDE